MIRDSGETQKGNIAEYIACEANRRNWKHLSSSRKDINRDSVVASESEEPVSDRQDLTEQFEKLIIVVIAPYERLCGTELTTSRAGERSEYGGPSPS